MGVSMTRKQACGEESIGEENMINKSILLKKTFYLSVGEF